MGDLCYGLVVLVPLLSTPDYSDAVTVRYRTALRRTGADFHRPILPPSQAHERGVHAASSRLAKTNLKWAKAHASKLVCQTSG